MPSQNKSTINLLLPILPETQNPELYKELVRIYNAINLLSSGIDSSTDNGTIVSSVQSILSEVTTLVGSLDKKLKKLETKLQVSSVPDYSAPFGQLNKLYYRYSVPKFTVQTILAVGTSASVGTTFLVGTDLTVQGKAGFNGQPPQFPGVTLAQSNAPAGGVGTAAGGWDTAVNRDAAIDAINSHAFAIERITDTLEAWGIMTP